MLDLPINTPRLFIRPFRETDISKAYLESLNCSQHMRFSNQRFKTHSVQSSRQFLSSINEANDLMIACLKRGTEELVGTMVLRYDRPHQRVDLSIMVLKQYVSMGFGIETWTAVVEATKDAPGVRKITAGTLALNVSMESLLQATGFQFECRRISHEIVEGFPVDVHYYSQFVVSRSANG